MSGYGVPGVERAMQLLKDEMEMNMRLIGATSVEELDDSLVDASNVSLHTSVAPDDYLSKRIYDPLTPPAFKPTKAKL